MRVQNTRWHLRIARYERRPKNTSVDSCGKNDKNLNNSNNSRITDYISLQNFRHRIAYF